MAEETKPASCGCCCGGGKNSGAIFIILAIVLMFLIVFNRSSREMGWITDYNEGVTIAREQNKPLLLTFESDSSSFCTDMRKNTYVDKDVIEYVTNSFVPVLINADDPENKGLVEQYAREINNYYPNHLVKYADKSAIRSVFGYKPPIPFIEKLKEALESVQSAAEN